MKAVLLVSHGSRFQSTEEEIKNFIEKLKQRSDIPIFEYAFLDIAHPSIPEGVDTCVEKGATEIIILLNFLNSGRHIDEDIPYIIGEVRLKYPDIIFHITKPVGRYDQITNLFLEMIQKSGRSD